MKIIFLDIDGVLNHQLFFEKKMTGEIKTDIDIDEKSVELLNLIIEETGAKVVVSSTWRMNNSAKELQQKLDVKGFKGSVIGVTPKLYFTGVKDYHYSVPRGNEIKAWIELNKSVLGDKVSKLKYVILDDDSDMLYWQRNKFVQIDSYCGLTPKKANTAIHILNS